MNINSLLSNYWLLIPLLVWTFFWKGIALWKAARRSQMGWFIVLLVLNTLGILEIIYIFLIAKKTAFAESEEKSPEEILKKKII